MLVERCHTTGDCHITSQSLRNANFAFVHFATAKAKFHYAIQVADLVCDLVADMLVRASS